MKKALLLCSILIFSLCLSPKANSGELDVLAFGAVLNMFADRVENVVRHAESVGKGVTIQAGVEANIAISNAKIAYENSLDTTVNKLDKTTSKKLQEIESMVSNLEQKANGDASSIIIQAQQIANTLPFSQDQPQLASFSPKFVAPSALGYTIPLELKGNFVHAGESDLHPYLWVDNKKFDLSQNSTQSLKFVIPIVEIASISVNKFSYKTVKLIVPYKEGWIFQTNKNREFKILIGILPASPGQITLMSKSIHEVMSTQHIRTNTWAQHSSNDDLDGTSCGPDHPDWRIIPETVRFVIEWTQGDENDQWSKTLVSINPHVCYQVHTVHHGLGTSGKVNYHFEYDIVQTKPVEDNITQAVDLKWGDSKSFPYTNNSWKVSLDSFDGHHNETSTVFDFSPFVKLSVGGDSLTIKALSASDVNWP